MIRLIAVDYHSNNLFHGDIKPDNIFYQNYNVRLFTTSDVGSLLHLGKQNDVKFIISCYTEKFASHEHIEAVKNKTPLTRG
jgi:serine/threonine protein kinase